MNQLIAVINIQSRKQSDRNFSMVHAMLLRNFELQPRFLDRQSCMKVVGVGLWTCSDQSFLVVMVGEGMAFIFGMIDSNLVVGLLTKRNSRIFQWCLREREGREEEWLQFYLWTPVEGVNWIDPCLCVCGQEERCGWWRCNLHMVSGQCKDCERRERGR